MKKISITLLSAICLLTFFGGSPIFCAEEKKPPVSPAPLNPADLAALAELTLAGDLQAGDTLWQNRKELAAICVEKIGLQHVFRENIPEVKILSALANLGDAEALEFIVGCASGNYKPSKDWATKILGDPVSKAVVLNQLKKLQAEKPKTRMDAVFSLAKLKDPCALRSIIALAGDSAPEVRLKVAEALNDFKSPLSVETAAKMARQDTDPDTRVAAINALAANASARTDVLVAALDDEDGYVRLAALAAMKTMHDKNAIPKLLNLLEKPGNGLKERQFTIVSSTQGNVVKTEVNTRDERHLRIIANSANEALKAITGQDFDFDSYHTAAEQMAERAKWLKWWQANEKTFTVKPPAPKTN